MNHNARGNRSRRSRRCAASLGNSRLTATGSCGLAAAPRVSRILAYCSVQQPVSPDPAKSGVHFVAPG